MKTPVRKTFRKEMLSLKQASKEMQAERESLSRSRNAEPGTQGYYGTLRKEESLGIKMGVIPGEGRNRADAPEDDGTRSSAAVYGVALSFGVVAGQGCRATLVSQGVDARRCRPWPLTNARVGIPQIPISNEHRGQIEPVNRHG
ncbi:hypothetical protein DPSP01_013784 [Paraphaeosphaeria sporulosa]|uniref:Uncharacterized protein n=1 Tax=Paraphaeosphaeria sporulosa TaxID=1460663 RepID=A0A177CG30_9PLEO|nr:uncharacterized protein CC84DRAFT_1176315 [Paraphaeosphaeria sporulosa]OAG06286.1 hypothetical protein CC84DRAFT_1176315 [Paraphaeosphaeria sporulosa]